MNILKECWSTWLFLALILYAIVTKADNFTQLWILLMWIASMLMSIEINCRKDKPNQEDK